MIRINGKQWDDLTFEDIEDLLNTDIEETFYLELKKDDVDNRKLAKEICAFANSFGGYLIIGINDDKEILGCTKWDEQRVHTVIFNNISPIPFFDIKNLRKNDLNILVIKVEEGIFPPYVTGTGKIYERVSSGSFPINNSYELGLLYSKRENQRTALANKIELPPLTNYPTNYCGCIDMGFSLHTHETFKIPQNFYDIEYSPLAEFVKSLGMPYSFSMVADSIVITIGEPTNTSNPNQKTSIPAGIIYMIEIMKDGSVRTRIPLIMESNNDNQLNILEPMAINIMFRDIYTKFVGDFASSVICAYKYEVMYVYKQFSPIFYAKNSMQDAFVDVVIKRNVEHIAKYGSNIIPIGHRIPPTGFNVIDQMEFSKIGIEYNSKNLIDWLFYEQFLNFGFIDSFDKYQKKENTDSTNN